ncbi:MAG TPA: RidA family protein [Candidatus Methylomirabilis sp.]|nr:RidA family protein [Candidatus Methylomirabilis sp.]
MSHRPVKSEALGPTLGMYSHGMVAPGGEIVVVAGQVGMDAAGRLVGPSDVVAQTKQAYANIEAVLQAAGASMQDVVRFQTFLVYRSDIDGFMQARREVFLDYFPDGVYPPNTILVVSHLVKPDLLVEIEAMAVKPVPRPAVARSGPARSRRTSRRRSAAKKRS